MLWKQPGSLNFWIILPSTIHWIPRHIIIIIIIIVQVGKKTRTEMKSQLLCIPVLLGLIQFTGAQYRPSQSAQEYGANPYPYDQNSDQLGQYGYVKNVLGKIGYPKGSGVYGRLTGEGVRMFSSHILSRFLTLHLPFSLSSIHPSIHPLTHPSIHLGVGT